MFDKILIAIGILLGSILVVENMVMWMYWYLFLDASSNVWVIVLVALFIWTAGWYWVRWLLSNNNNNEYETDDFNF